MNSIHKDRVVDSDEELFWKDVKDAVRHVELNHALSYTVEYSTRTAEIKWEEKGTLLGEWLEIRIYEHEPKQPALLVP